VAVARSEGAYFSVRHFSVGAFPVSAGHVRHRQENAGQKYQEHAIETPRATEPTQVSLKY